MTIQGSYPDDKWVDCFSQGRETVVCEKHINNAGRGIYEILGSITSRAESDHRSIATDIPYSADIIYSNEQADTRKSGTIESTSSCRKRSIASFSVK